LSTKKTFLQQLLWAILSNAVVDCPGKQQCCRSFLENCTRQPPTAEMLEKISMLVEPCLKLNSMFTGFDPNMNKLVVVSVRRLNQNSFVRRYLLF